MGIGSQTQLNSYLFNWILHLKLISVVLEYNYYKIAFFTRQSTNSWLNF